MEKPPLSKTLRRVIIFHLVVISACIFIPVVLSKISPMDPPPDVMRVSLVSAPERPNIQEITEIPPEPVVESPPIPAPPPEIKPIPEPPKEKKKIEVSKKRIRRDVDPPKPRLTQEQIKKQLALQSNASPPSNTSEAPLPAWYYASVREQMYQVWSQPTALSAAAGYQVRVQLTVNKAGKILDSKILSRSGQPEMDESVNAAIQTVRQLKPLPASFSKNKTQITITFELTRG